MQRPESLENKVLGWDPSTSLQPCSAALLVLLSHPITTVHNHLHDPGTHRISSPLGHSLEFAFASKASSPLNLAFYSSSTSCSLKKKEILLYVTKWMTLEVTMLWKPAVERQTLHDSIYMRYLESSNLRQSRNWVSGARIKGRRRVAVQCQ